MGVTIIRRLVLAAAAGALLASGAAASFYSYETYWREYLFFGDDSFYMGFLGGDDSAIGVPFTAGTAAGGGYVGYSTFDSNGFGVGGGMFWDNAPVYLESARIYGFVLINGEGLGAFSVYYYDVYQERYFKESYLKYDGLPAWEMKTDDYADFRALARTADRQYIYCYMNYMGAFQICKITALGAVVSYFTPVAEPDDMAVDGAGYIYALTGDRVRKYDDTGSVIVAWYAPVPLTDISVDEQNRLLALSNINDYTYVFSDAGALLGSFTAPYENYGGYYLYGDTGPDGKYYVGYPYGPVNESDWFVDAYRFAPSPTNIVPTSLGKIKAMYN